MRVDDRSAPDNPGNGRDEYVREESVQKESGREESLPDRDSSKSLIGVILDSFGVSYGCGLVNGMERECGKRGFHMILKCTRGSMEEESKAVDDLLALGVQGIILMCVQGENYNANVLRLSLEHFPIVGPHGVDNKVGVDVVGIGVGGHQHFTAGPGFFRKFLCQLVRRCPGDVLLRMEGLSIVVKVHRAFLAVHLPGGQELLDRELGRTVDPADQPLSLGFLFLLHIGAHPGEGTGRLPLVLDEIHCRHYRHSLSASSLSLL